MNNKIKILVKNFKAIHEVDISLNENTNNRLIAIIGNNNCGKSSFLEAIKKLGGLPIIATNDVTTFLNKSGRITEPNDEDLLKPKIKIKFNFYDFNDKKIKEIETYIEKNYFNSPNFSKKWMQKQEENIKKEIKEFKRKYEDEYEKYKAFISPDNINGFPTTFTDENCYEAFLYTIKESKKYNEIKKDADKIKQMMAYQKINKKINIDSIDNINIFKYSKLEFNLLDKNSNENQELEKQAILKIWEKILKVSFQDLLNSYSTNKKEINKIQIINNFENEVNRKIEQISKEFYNEDKLEKLEIFMSEDRSSLNIQWKNKSQGKKIVHNNTLSNTGDGMKHLWSIILRMEAIDESIPSIILIDEPEKCLNPHNQNYLLKYFKEITSKKERINQVLIYTTHSPFMIDWEIYDNIHNFSRDINKHNGVISKKIYQVKNKGIPNLLWDKNEEIRFIQSLPKTRKEKVLFVEGISDFYVMSNLLKLNNKENILIIPLFGGEYKRALSFHLPFFISYMKDQNIKLLVDNDKAGNEIKKWAQEETIFIEKNIKTYHDFFQVNDLETAIIRPWFKKNKLEIKENKKINAIEFQNNNKEITQYQKLIEWIVE